MLYKFKKFKVSDNSVCSYSAEAYFNIGIFIILLLNIVNEFSDVSRENILKRFSSAEKDILQLCYQVLNIVYVGAY